MVFTTLRAYESGLLATPLICSEADFANAIRIVETLLEHALSVYWRLPRSGSEANADDENTQVAKQKQRCRELREQGMSIRKIAVEVFGSDAKKSTVNRWLA